MNDNKKVIFFGTPEFAKPTLKALFNEGYEVMAVVTQPDKPVGRKQILTPSPVKVAAQNLGLKVMESLDIKKIASAQAEVGIVAAYGKIIPQKVLALFPLGCLNIHPSLLPKYRGPSPIQTAIFNGDEITGVSIIKLDNQIDHGELVSRITHHISKEDTYESLLEKLSSVGAKLLIKTLQNYLSGKIKPIAQDDSLATFTRILKRPDGKINWHKSAAEIERQIRAYYPWPGSSAMLETFAKGESTSPASLREAGLAGGKNLKLKTKILAAQVSDNIDGETGQLQNKDGQLYVQCGQGSLIIEKLQPEGKKEMTGQEFINGYLKSQ